MVTVSLTVWISGLARVHSPVESQAYCHHNTYYITFEFSVLCSLASSRQHNLRSSQPSSFMYAATSGTRSRIHRTQGTIRKLSSALFFFFFFSVRARWSEKCCKTGFPTFLLWYVSFIDWKHH